MINFLYDGSKMGFGAETSRTCLRWGRETKAYLHVNFSGPAFVSGVFLLQSAAKNCQITKEPHCSTS